MARYYLGGRRGLLILAGLAVAAGLALNWSWLVAVGIAPILIAGLPCLAMCALGLCMSRAGGKSCSAAGSNQGPARDDVEPSIQAQAATLEARSEEHTSELQSLMRSSYAVFCLKKKKLQHTKSTSN